MEEADIKCDAKHEHHKTVTAQHVDQLFLHRRESGMITIISEISRFSDGTRDDSNKRSRVDAVKRCQRCEVVKCEKLINKESADLALEAFLLWSGLD